MKKSYLVCSLLLLAGCSTQSTEETALFNGSISHRNDSVRLYQDKCLVGNYLVIVNPESVSTFSEGSALAVKAIARERHAGVVSVPENQGEIEVREAQRLAEPASLVNCGAKADTAKDNSR